MKKALVLLCTLMSATHVFGQAYIVTYLKGKVYHDHQLLKLHDKINDVSELSSDDKSAELAVFSAQKGKFRLSFVNSKGVKTNLPEKKSELYQMVVGNYLLKYTTEKTLTARGDFDLQVFFTPSDTGSHGAGLFLLENEMLPLKSQSINISKEDQFFICPVTANGTSCNPVTRNSHFLVFDHKTAEGVFGTSNAQPVSRTCLIQLAETDGNKQSRENLASAAKITFLPGEYLDTLTASFMEGLESYYKGDKDKLIGDIEEQLAYYYGHSYEPAVRQVLKTYIDKRNQ